MKKMTATTASASCGGHPSEHRLSLKSRSMAWCEPWRTDPARFAFSGLSPARQTTPVLKDGKSLVPAFLSTCEIEWNFGREPNDPTHEILFFNDATGERAVVLRLSFVADGATSTAPGLTAELVLGRDAAGPADGRRGGYLDELFSMLQTALRPDFGHVELPGYPRKSGWPNECTFGWITYFSRNERPSLPDLRPPAVAVRVEGGTKLFATPGLALEQHADVAAAIEHLREQRVRHGIRLRWTGGG